MDNSQYIQEAYKVLRTNVTYSLDDEEGGKLIMLASAHKNERKSITAINLAASFACAGNRVLLMECNLRRPILGKLLDLKYKKGLSLLLLNPDMLSDCIAPSGVPGLEVILAGDVPSNPSELLGSPGMQKIFDRLKEIYDFVIIDTSPVNLVTDASILAPYVNGVLLVVRADVSDKESVARALEQLEYSKTKILGFVLNGLKMKKWMREVKSYENNV